MIQVFHVVLRNPKSPTLLPFFGLADGEAARIMRGEHPDYAYHKVAEVDVIDLDDAYQLTNTITGPWWENDAVKVEPPGRFRSTSMGDMLLDAEGQYWNVAAFGFTPVYGIKV